MYYLHMYLHLVFYIHIVPGAMSNLGRVYNVHFPECRTMLASWSVVQQLAVLCWPAVNVEKA